MKNPIYLGHLSIRQTEMVRVNCKWVQFQDSDIIICFQQHTKNAIFQNETISVKSNEQYAKKSRLQMVFKMSTVSVHTLSLSSMLPITILLW